MATARWQGAEWHKAQASADQGKNTQTTPTTRKKEATQILKLLTFSGNRETKEDRSGTKHIGAKKGGKPGLGRRGNQSTLCKELQE
jgi:hypothetical protein